MDKDESYLNDPMCDWTDDQLLAELRNHLVGQTRVEGRASSLGTEIGERFRHYKVEAETLLENIEAACDMLEQTRGG